MSLGMDETFSAAVRELLVEQAQGDNTRRAWLRWPQRWGVRFGLLLAIVAGGSGLAAAAGVVFSGGPPGSQQVTALAAPVTVTGNGTQAVQLGRRPAGANAIYVYFSCLTPGTFTFSDGASVSCADRSDAAAMTAHPSMTTVSLSPGQSSTTITAAPGESWRLKAIYVTATTTPWAVNASGQTFGTANQNGSPDLVAVIATNHRSGYVYANQLLGPQPTNPGQAAIWAQTHPGPRTLTVYESDGKTPVGIFVIGNPTSKKASAGAAVANLTP